MAFHRLLVANRGEIARRILVAARRCGLETVAVYSAADRAARHVREADAAVAIGPAAAADSYLSIAAVMEAVQRSGADALHPGYGFLAESEELAARCEEAGVVFVGPPARVIGQMGRKDEARHLAASLGVPVVAGVEGGDLDDLAQRGLEELGLPLLIKAVAGGGGKAMHVVRDGAEFPRLLEVATREARASFGDGALLLERLVEGARHVEVQVLCDRHGNAVHLFERDCSLQRRHQKVIEEAPAPELDEALRERLRQSALALARGIGYENAGTVEFLVRGEEHYFLEMNTRLQVEHRVTEAVTGKDLVDLQLRIAQGDPIPFTQDVLEVRGHAIEARVYAEDPDAAFLPQAGWTRLVHWPNGVLVDEALETGDEVTSFYDPMLAKLVAYGPTRDDARRRLVAAIDNSAVIGVTTNLAFLRGILEAADFVAGTVDTEWIEREHPSTTPADNDAALVIACLAAFRRATGSGPFGIGDGWRLGSAPGAGVVELFEGTKGHELRHAPDSGTVEIAGRTVVVHAIDVENGWWRAEIDGLVEAFGVVDDNESITVSHRGAVRCFTRAKSEPALAAPTSGVVQAPVPGIVTAIHVTAGSKVAEGALVANVESMKMELELRAGIAGTVLAIATSVGEHVRRGQLLVELVPEDDR